MGTWCDELPDAIDSQHTPSEKGKYDEEEQSFEDGRVHSLKHYFVSRCADSGVPEQVVKAWLWCKSSRMIDRYYHPDKDVAERHMNSVKFVTDDDATT